MLIKGIVIITVSVLGAVASIWALVQIANAQTSNPTLTESEIVIWSGQKMGVGVKAYDQDAGQTLTLSPKGSLPAGMTIEGPTAITPPDAKYKVAQHWWMFWRPTAAQAGSHSIEYCVKDSAGGEVCNGAVKFTVKENHDPFVEWGAWGPQ